MRKKIAVWVAIVALLLGSNVFAVQLRLPFSGGETWRCDQGNNSVTGPTHSGLLRYAWDFNFGAGYDDLGLPVLSPAAGRVIYARNSNSSWGNTVIIDYGDQSYGKISHLERIDVSEGDSVNQGQQIGTCGGTGLTTTQWSPHIHYQTQNSNDLNGQSIQSSFIDTDVARHNGIPLEGYSYRSDNYIYPVGHYSNGIHTDGSSRAIATCYALHGGASTFGKAWDNGSGVWAHSWPDNSSDPDAIYLQDFLNGDHWWVIAENKFEEQAFPIHGRILDKWIIDTGYRNYGPPMECEKYWNAPNGHKIVYQHFTNTGILKVIAYDTVTGLFLNESECEDIPLILDDSGTTFEDALIEGGIDLILDLSGCGGGSSSDDSSASTSPYGSDGAWVEPPINPMCATAERGQVYFYCGMSAINNAIDMASDGDTIVLHPGNYHESINFKGKAITLTSENPDDQSIVNATRIRGVYFDNGEGRDSKLAGITITGNSDHGIYCESSSPVISKCVISNNVCDISGGGIYITDGSSPLITNCIIENNSSRYNEGGGISIYESSPQISNCIIRNNRTGGCGGGIFIGMSKNLTIAKCVITGNTADQNGGGISLKNSSFNLINSVVVGNTTKISGGGVSFIESGDSKIINCTVADNTTTEKGGGIYGECHDVRILNSIAWNNTPDDIYLNGYGLSISYCDYKVMPYTTPNDGKLSWDPDRNILLDNIDVDPLFADSAKGDYHLTSNSPCIGRGTNLDDIADDMDGNNRPIGARYDIGAYEFLGGAAAYGYTQMGHIYEGEKIQPMIEMSNDGGIIIIHRGTYAENIDFMGKPIHLKSENPYDLETVQSTILTKYWSAPIVKFRYGLNASNSSLSGFTIENGGAEYGAGIYIESCAPTISNCIIRGNYGSYRILP